MVEYTCRCGLTFRMSADAWNWHRWVECLVWRRLLGYIR